MNEIKFDSSVDPKLDKIDKLANDAAQEDSTASFMEPAKKRGRKKGGKNKPKENVMGTGGGDGPRPLQDVAGQAGSVEQIKQYVKPMFQIISGLGVKIAENEKAALSETELDILTTSSANCINHYLPGIMGAHADLMILCACFGQWGFRVYLLREQEKARILEERRRMQGIASEPAYEEKVPNNPLDAHIN